jgi:adenylosuccinate lyase
VTNHDVKAWILIKDAFEKLGLSEYKEFIHFGLTSLLITLRFRYLQSFRSMHAFFDYFDIKIEDLSIEWTFNACTHGQPASRVWGKKLVFL